MAHFLKLYEGLVLNKPKVTLSLLFCIVLFSGYHAPQFRLDASSESLSLKNDQALQYYRSIKKEYGSDDYLIITYTPDERDLLSDEVLFALLAVKQDLLELERIQSVTSILDAPLINSPPLTLKEITQSVPTLMDEKTDRELAYKEFMSSPFYKNLLISENGETTALLVNFKQDKILQNLIAQRNMLQEEGGVDASIEAEYKLRNAQSQKQQQKDISNIRAVLEQHQGLASYHLGGVPMIVADSIDFISRDLRVFGLSVLCFLIILLTLIFRKPRWVILPMLTCFCVGISLIGFLGLVDWPATIVSANFISLILIFTLSFCIHQIVRYREFQAQNPEADQLTLVRDTVFDIGVPCFYMAFTTAVGFSSLIVSNIQPVIDFGWMMTIGILFSFVISFILMPAALMLLKPLEPIKHFDMTRIITQFFFFLIQNYRKLILSIFFIVVAFSIWGMSNIYVQNRFIDYYKKDTEIYQGMKVIDEQLGGTTPLDVIVTAPQDFIEFQKEEKEFLIDSCMYEGTESPAILDGYWLSDILLDDVAAIHKYLDDLPESGKTLSLHTTFEVLKDLDGEATMDRLYMGVLYKKLPQDIREILFAPYISEDGNELRFSVRVFESQEGLNREALLEKIRLYLTDEMGFAHDQIHLTGMLVLYNNVLQTLFQSQILTIGVVFITMLLIFWLLFRNLKVAVVAIIPNIAIVTVVLGMMGWMNIPLDIMTITIAAICFGMADDDTIHYIHRFMAEFKKTGNYWQAVKNSHNTIGRAMYYTTITIMLGFSILAFSNFVPTMYFGLLTGFSMLVALLFDLMLLPLLLILFKPLGKQIDNKATREIGDGLEEN